MFTFSRASSRRPALIGAASMSGLALAAMLAGPAIAEDNGTSPPSVAAGSSSAALSAQTAKDLAFSREEERMARDLYAALAKVHNDARPMSMIATSEQRHFDAVGTLLTRYGLADPAAGRAAGSYADPELQKLYDDWYARGTVSLGAAYQVGIELEQRDIADLKRLQSRAAPDDVQAVYANLLRGSENHLSAFQNAAAGRTPGTGNGNSNGRGNARGGMNRGNGTNGAGPGMAQARAGANTPGAGMGGQARMGRPS